jgi:PAS domain S-box-containing protein
MTKISFTINYCLNFTIFKYLFNFLKIAREMLNKEQDIFNVLFEAVSEGVIVVDDKQKIVSVNSSVEKIFGYEKGELINESLNILIPKNYHAGHGAHFKGFMKQKEKRQMGNGRDLYGVLKN